MAGYIGSKASVVSSGAERKKTFTITGSTTSLTGLNYTVGKVHVFQNGVRLVDGTDYTATNGTTITLTAAAQSGDNVVVISQASFQVADLPAGTPSIDDNGDATAITIDSSERVLIGKASAGYNVDGFEAHQNGETYVSRSGTPMAINRNSSDGTLLNLYKDGAGVGSIKSAFSSSIAIDGAANRSGVYLATSSLVPRYNASNIDATVDLGGTSTRFKDLYLSGGVYLGGTGSANKLDDFESGTWTPTLGGNAQYDIQSGDYIKVGGLVYASFAIRPTSLGTGSNNRVSGLPFSTADSVGLTIQYYDGAATNHYSISGGVTSNYLNMYLKTSSINSAYNSTNFFQNNTRIYASIIYRTTA